MNSMILEMSEYPVSRIKFAEQFSYRSGTLEVDRAAVVQLILADQRILSADCEIVAPGERVRITGVRDIVEPRIKCGNDAQVFPGTLGPVIAVGKGETHRLSGIAVVTAAAYEGTVRAEPAFSAAESLICGVPEQRFHDLART